MPREELTVMVVDHSARAHAVASNAFITTK